MTRESYFKIAESQGLQTMREQSIAFADDDTDPFNRTRKSGVASPSPLGGWKTGMKKNGSDNFVSICVSPNEDSVKSSRYDNKKKLFSRRH